MLNLFQDLFSKFLTTIAATTVVITSFLGFSTPFLKTTTQTSLQSPPISSVISPTPQITQELLAITPTRKLTTSLTKKSSSNTINLTPTSNPNPTSGQSQVEAKKVKACFTYSGESAGGDVYYIDKPLNLVATCTENAKNVKEFRWYISGKYGSTIKPTGIIVNTNIDHIYGDSNTIKSYEIKLEVVGKDDSTDSVTKIIKMKEIPKPKSCVSPDSATRGYINFNEEVTFSGACTQDSPENPIIKSFWRFRDGTSDESIIKDGKEVTHKFTKFSKNFWKADCSYSGGKGFEAEYCVETKLGIGGFCTIHQFCPSANDPLIQNLANCSKQASKDLDKCIVEMGL